MKRLICRKQHVLKEIKYISTEGIEQLESGLTLPKKESGLMLPFACMCIFFARPFYNTLIEGDYRDAAVLGIGSVSMFVGVAYLQQVYLRLLYNNAANESAVDTPRGLSNEHDEYLENLASSWGAKRSMSVPELLLYKQCKKFRMREGIDLGAELDVGEVTTQPEQGHVPSSKDELPTGKMLYVSVSNVKPNLQRRSTF